MSLFSRSFSSSFISSLSSVTASASVSAAAVSSSFRSFSTQSSSSSSSRPFRILGLQQIAVGSSSKSSLSRLWVELFGLTKLSTFSSVTENVNEDILQLGRGAGAVEVDIMEPLDVNKTPKVHQPSLNHIGLWVDNLPEAVNYLKSQGMRFTPGGIRKGASGYDVCFIHPKGNAEFPVSGEGVLIELVQAPQKIIEELSK